MIRKLLTLFGYGLIIFGHVYIRLMKMVIAMKILEVDAHIDTMRRLKKYDY